MTNSLSLKVLVIGGAGYIGSHVNSALIKAGHQPTVFDNLSSGLRENLFENIPFIHGDVLLSEHINKAVIGMDAIIHLAALKAAGESMLKPEVYIQNITGAINILNAAVAAGVSQFIFSSTAAVYGDPQYLPIDEEHPTDPVNFYGFTKLEIERLLAWYDQLKGIKYVNLRYFNAAGYDMEGNIKGLEQNPQNLFPLIMEAVMGKRTQVDVYGNDYDTADGTGIRDYIHVTDLADAHVSALNYLIENQQSNIFNLGSSSGTSVLEALETTKKMTGARFKVNMVPRRPGDPPVVLANPQKANQILNWKAKYSNAEDIVRTMLDAYRNQ
ncbi:MAG: UDP-glucose 4-epimerase GalE [SAR324 cluster bacterium]|nr:UDP-glucose 4-epimerase GalE [SAR324 cluster bacterium]